MIRIDEIYSNTFWPYIQRHVPLTRLFFCDPPGHTKPENLFNYGQDIWEKNYIFLHDQEPVHSDIHESLFSLVSERNLDLCHWEGPRHAGIITSEYNSEFVDQVCSSYSWKPYYYFFHGWAAMDWYRGYHRSFLSTPPDQRKINYSFINPNRIVGGKRNHRLLLMYHLLKRNLSSSLISFPRTCPHEDQDIFDLIQPFAKKFPDISDVFQKIDLPLNFPGETGHPMHSCWLSLFELCDQSLCYVVTETVFHGRRYHLTEKTFKPICQRVPFILASTAGSLGYLRRYGFKTFGDFWDESYDDEIDDHARIERIAELLKYFDGLSQEKRQQLFESTIPVLEHNYQHFYGGDFEKILWQELLDMLNDISRDFNQ